MHASDIVDCLADANPAWKYGNIGNETDIAHQLVALIPRVAPEHFELSLVSCKAENRVQRCSLAGAIWANQTENTAFFHTQVHAVKRNGIAKRLTQPTSFYACHSSALLLLSGV